MSDYNVWADLFDTWQSSSDWIKALLIITPPAFGLGMVALLLRHRARMQRQVWLSGHGQWMEPRPKPHNSTPPATEIPMLTGLRDAQTRLEQGAKQVQYRPELARIPQKCPDILRPETVENHPMSDEEIRQRFHDIIVEEHRRGRPPGEALQRVRKFLLDLDD